MHDGLRQFGKLLHAERIGPEFAVAHLAESDVEKGFVRALHGMARREPGELSHIANEANARHVGNEGIILWHVTDQISDGLDIGTNIFAEDACGTGSGWIEAQ